MHIRRKYPFAFRAAFLFWGVTPLPQSLSVEEGLPLENM